MYFTLILLKFVTRENVCMNASFNVITIPHGAQTQYSLPEEFTICLQFLTTEINAETRKVLKPTQQL